MKEFELVDGSNADKQEELVSQESVGDLVLSEVQWHFSSALVIEAAVVSSGT